MKERVLLADDHSLVTEGLERLLTPRYEVVGRVADGRSLLEAVRLLKPDLVILDIAMPLLNGIDAARHLKKTSPDVKLVVLTMHSEPTYVSEAFAAGAAGYLVKTSAASELLFAVEEVLKGHTYVSPVVAKTLVTASLQPQLSSTRAAGDAAPLTARQREVLQLVAEGKSVKEIARHLGVSPKTAEFHKAQLREHLGLKTTAELTRYAISHGIVSS